MKITGIYKITSPSGRVYVGQAVNIKKRFSDYKKLIHCKRQTRLYNSLIKYQPNKHTFEIIEECSIDLLNERERYWQDFYDVLSRSGLNCVLQNSNEKVRVFSNETLKRMSVSKQGYKNPMFGKKQTSETLLKKTGVNHPMYGKKHSEESLDKIRGKNNFMFGKTGELCPNSKRILDTETGEIYSSIKEAAEIIGINYYTLAKYLKGKRKNKTNLIYEIE